MLRCHIILSSLSSKDSNVISDRNRYEKKKNKNPMIHFCTFGTRPTCAQSVSLITKEAIASQYFDTCRWYDQSIVPAHHRSFVHRHPRGYGYWFWKTFVLLDMFDRVLSLIHI